MSEIEKETIYVLPMVAVNGFRSRAGELLVALMDNLNFQHFAPMHLFPDNFNGCVGRVFDVKITSSGYVLQVFPSQMQASDLFDPIVGYVDYYDDRNGHYHIYDNQSRHFVANNSSIKSLAVGSFVEFCPLVPKNSKFKMAVVTKCLNFDEGVSQFGTFCIEIMEVNEECGWYRYKVLSELPELEEGWIREIGRAFSNIDTLQKLCVGQRLKAIMFLRRCKKGEEKMNYIAKLLGV